MIEIKKEDYLSRLQDEDRQNLIIISDLFGKVLAGHNLNGGLIAVGGTVTRELPRKDIDLIAVLELRDDRPNIDVKDTPYRLALAEFGILRCTVEEMITRGEDFRMERVFNPAIDEEFGSESILKHDGSITIQPDRGTLIEIIRSSKRTIDDFTRSARKPFVVLTIHNE